MAGHEVIVRNPHEIGTTGYPHRKIMMWLFLASDCMFFGSLIATYLVYRGHSTAFPFPEDVFNIALTSVSSFVLLMSSFLMVLALNAIQEGDLFKYRLWLGGTALFGALFLGFQVYEFSHFVSLGLTLQGNLFGSTFYVLTGTHGLHVAIGVLWLLCLFFYSFRPGAFDKKAALDVEIAGLYWHFVDIVWIVIFGAIYILEFVI